MARGRRPRAGRIICDAMLARKGQRAVAIKCSFMPLGPAADATRRRSRSLERPADRAGWRTASLQQASKACCPKSKQARHFPRAGENGGLGFRREFLRAQARKIPPLEKWPFAGSSQPSTVAALRGYFPGSGEAGDWEVAAERGIREWGREEREGIGSSKSGKHWGRTANSTRQTFPTKNLLTGSYRESGHECQLNVHVHIQKGVLSS
jgi:hypothetical protein